MSVQMDIFPALVTVAPSDSDLSADALTVFPMTKGAYQISIARVVVMNGKVVIAQEQGGGATVVLEGTFTPDNVYKAPNNRTTPSYVTLDDGRKIAFQKDSGCGCGSRLKSWNPYGNLVKSAKDPSA